MKRVDAEMLLIQRADEYRAIWIVAKRKKTSPERLKIIEAECKLLEAAQMLRPRKKVAHA